MTSDPTPVQARDDHVDRLHYMLDSLLIPAAERGDGRVQEHTSIS